MNGIGSEISALLAAAAEDSEFASSLPSPLLGYVGKLVEHAEFATWYIGGKLCGLIAFYANDPNGRDAFISMIAVAPEVRRMGIARALVGAVLTNLSSRGFEQCRLEVRAYNKGAMLLYRDVGFTRDGISGDVVKMCIRLPLPHYAFRGQSDC